MYPKVIERDVVKRNVIDVEPSPANELTTPSNNLNTNTGWNITKTIFKGLWSFISWLILAICKVIGWTYRYIKKQEMTPANRWKISIAAGLLVFSSFGGFSNSGSAVIVGIPSIIWILLINQTLKFQRKDWLIGSILGFISSTFGFALFSFANAHHSLDMLEAIREGGYFSLLGTVPYYFLALRKKIVAKI